MRQAGRVSEYERERAIRRNSDTTYASTIGKGAGLGVIRRLQQVVLAAYRAGRDPRFEIKREFESLRELVLQGMLYARLRGLDREIKDVARLPASIKPDPIEFATSPAYRRGIKFLRKRMRVTEPALLAMTQQMDAHVVRVLATASTHVQRELMREVAVITAANMHVRDGVKALKSKFGALDLKPGKAGRIEAIFRTQTQLAYAAGNAQVLRDPDIDEILWGYKYVTAGDDRVRSSHMAMDGVTLPKDDPFWIENKPPNGWRCRCELIPIFRARREVKPPDTVTETLPGGTKKTVRVGADEGFRVDPGKLFPPTH